MAVCVKENQLDTQIILSIFRQPVHVSGVSRPIIRRYDRKYTTTGTYYYDCSVVLVGLEQSNQDNRTGNIQRISCASNWVFFLYTIVSRCTVNKTQKSLLFELLGLGYIGLL